MTKKCIGCGIELQTENKNNLGYIESLNKDICERCFELSNYGIYTPPTLSNNDYLKIISSIPSTSLIVYLTDILSLNLPHLNKFKNVILVVTKKDLLPKSISTKKIISYLESKVKVKDIEIISSVHNYNLDELYNKIEKYSSPNKYVYLVGQTNSGKSTLINKIIKNYSNNKPNLTTSIYPSTTLNEIKIKINNLTIIDTPGLISKRNISNYITKEQLKEITPKKEIKPKICQIKNKGSIIIEKYMRIDYNTNNSSSIIFYISNNLNIRYNSLKNSYLKNYPHKKFIMDGRKDLVIEGLGFLKITKPVTLDIYIPNETIAYTREKLI